MPNGLDEKALIRLNSLIHLYFRCRNRHDQDGICSNETGWFSLLENETFGDLVTTSSEVNGDSKDRGWFD